MLYAKRDIAPGEEVTFDYGMAWAEFNTACFCGAPACSGYLNGRKRPCLKRAEERLDQRPNAGVHPLDLLPPAVRPDSAPTPYDLNEPNFSDSESS